MMKVGTTVKNWFTGRRYRINAAVAGFYQLKEIGPDDLFTGRRIVVPRLTFWALYKETEHVTLARCLGGGVFTNMNVDTWDRKTGDRIIEETTER